MTEKLKPCPFCKEVLLKFYVHSLQSDRYEHPMNDCLLEGMLIMSDQIEAWNNQQSSLTEAEAREEFPDTEADGKVFCGKCGKAK